LLEHNIATLDELRYKLTIDQVHLFFEKCLKKQLNDRQFLAICTAQAINYASIPPMGADSSYFRKKQRMWEKFINSLDWDKNRKKKDIRQIQRNLSALVPIKIKKGDK